MGTNAGVVWIVGCLYCKPAPFFAATDQSFLDQPRFIFEPWRLFFKPGHTDDSLRVSTIFVGRKAAMDCRNGSDRSRQCREDQVLDGEFSLPCCDHGVDYPFVSHVTYANRANPLFRRC